MPPTASTDRRATAPAANPVAAVPAGTSTALAQPAATAGAVAPGQTSPAESVTADPAPALRPPAAVTLRRPSSPALQPDRRGEPASGRSTLSRLLFGDPGARTVSIAASVARAMVGATHRARPGWDGTMNTRPPPRPHPPGPPGNAGAAGAGGAQTGVAGAAWSAVLLCFLMSAGRVLRRHGIPLVCATPRGAVALIQRPG